MFRSAKNVKWGTLQRDAYVWITFRSRIERERGNGISSAKKRLAMAHALFAGKGSTGIDDKKFRRGFKYVETA